MAPSLHWLSRFHYLAHVLSNEITFDLFELEVLSQSMYWNCGTLHLRSNKAMGMSTMKAL
jgi:hypothetical protein